MRPSGGITHDTTIGRSGHSSIRFVSKTDKGIEQGLTGPELMVTPGRQVKISAWVKTANVTGEGFYLESGFQRWTPAGHEQIGPMYRSAKLTGTNDWTLLEIPLPVTPAKAEFLGKGRITFRLGGKGTAWVDDFVFAEQDAGRPAGVRSQCPGKAVDEHQLQAPDRDDPAGTRLGRRAASAAWIDSGVPSRRPRTGLPLPSSTFLIWGHKSVPRPNDIQMLLCCA